MNEFSCPSLNPITGPTTNSGEDGTWGIALEMTRQADRLGVSNALNTPRSKRLHPIVPTYPSVQK